EMSARRLAWARAASRGKPATPSKPIIQTSFWAPQRRELNLQEAEVLRLLGFNTVGNQSAEVRAKFAFRVPGHSHDVRSHPAATRDDIDQLMQRLAKGHKEKFAAGVPFHYSDEITAGTIGTSKPALGHFHAWLRQRGVRPADLGVKALEEVVPTETPDVL